MIRSSSALSIGMFEGTLAALAAGIAKANERYPSAPREMRDAVEAQLHRLASSHWE